MSMIREVTDRGLDRQIHLIYGSRKEDDIVFHEELADRSSYADQFKLSHVISEPSSEYSGAKGFIFYMFEVLFVLGYIFFKFMRGAYPEYAIDYQ